MHTNTIRELHQLLLNKHVSAIEVTQYFLERIEHYNPMINGFISVNTEAALQTAQQAQALIDKGKAHVLTGIPVAHKDLFCAQGEKTSCASKMLDNFTAPYQATMVEKLNACFMPSLGKTNMDEFAMGSSNKTSYYGQANNPWDISCVPGGSSGGAAAAVAAGLAPVATGSDTGGSIRQPAAFCGVTGIKPTYGSISRYGMVAFASSLDQAGPLTRSAEDAAIVLEAMVGQDPKDATSVAHPKPQFVSRLEHSIQGIKVGLPKPYFTAQLDSTIADKLHQVAKQLEKLGATIVEIDLAHTELAVPCYYIIAPAEASSNLSRYDGVRFGYRAANSDSLEDLYLRTRSEGFGDEVKRRILVGTYVLSSGYYDAYYRKAQKVRRLIKTSFNQALAEVDVLLTPTAPSIAFKHNQINTDDPVQMYLADLYTIAVNLAGLPALSMPCGFEDGMPVGAQLIGNYFDESLLLNIAHQYQCHTDFHLQQPVLAEGEIA